MGQKSIDSFLIKKPDGTSRGKVMASTAAGGPGDGAAAATGEPQAVVAAAGAGAGVAPAAAEQPADVHQAQAIEQQHMRAHANRNAALAKQVVLKAEAVGGLPRLGELLVEDSWRHLLSSELDKPYFADLEAFVRSEWAGSQMVFPPKDCVFRALNSCPVDKVRVVILGQDPYHDLGQAMGLSFSVPHGRAVPSSLRNMYKELREDLGCEGGRGAVPKHGNLEKWAHQGVLLLNAVLTVRAHSAASHAKKGWEKFTDAAISRLSKQRSGVVFLLWGRYAQDKGKVIDKSKHHVLTAAHPSGLSANRGFFGCRHFSQTNRLLEKDGQLPIDWCIE